MTSDTLPAIDPGTPAPTFEAPNEAGEPLRAVGGLRFMRFLQRPASSFRRRLLIVLLVSVPLWIYAATWDITTMLFNMAVDAKGGVGVMDVVRQILERLPLFPLLVGTYLVATNITLQRRKTSRFTLWQMGVAAVFLLLTYPLLVASYYLVHHAFDTTLSFGKVMHDYMHWQYWMGGMIQYSIVYLLGLVLLFGLNAFLRYKSEQIKSAQLQSKWLEARLGTLRGQMNPHFLFNALNTIVSLIHLEPDRAENLLTALSALLRRSLADSYNEFTTVKDELYFVERYIAVMKARYEDRLSVNLRLDKQVADYVIPTFLLVPFVENAIKHGVAKATGKDTVEISGRYAGDYLTFAVTNVSPTVAGHDDTVEHISGVGLRNTRLRLSAIYGDNYRLECGTDNHGHWKSSVSIPVKNAPDFVYLTVRAG
ncbi:MAG: sensor histidine kinase [Gammaproteobacteria bacterium]